jgi:hypothetical protein
MTAAQSSNAGAAVAHRLRARPFQTITAIGIFIEARAP